MPGFTSNFVNCAGRERHYTEWGAEHGFGAETVIACTAWRAPGATWTTWPRSSRSVIA